jgi:hypothetical protein
VGKNFGSCSPLPGHVWILDCMNVMEDWSV